MCETERPSKFLMDRTREAGQSCDLSCSKISSDACSVLSACFSATALLARSPAALIRQLSSRSRRYSCALATMLAAPGGICRSPATRSRALLDVRQNGGIDQTCKGTGSHAPLAELADGGIVCAGGALFVGDDYRDLRTHVDDRAQGHGRQNNDCGSRGPKCRKPAQAPAGTSHGARQRDATHQSGAQTDFCREGCFSSDEAERKKTIATGMRRSRIRTESGRRCAAAIRGAPRRTAGHRLRTRHRRRRR